MPGRRKVTCKHALLWAILVLGCRTAPSFHHQRTCVVSRDGEASRTKELRECRLVLRDEPSNSDAAVKMCWLSMVLLEEDGEVTCRHALSLAPHAIEAHGAMGCILMRRKQWAMAASHFEKALQTNAQYRLAARNRCTALMRMGRHIEASTCYAQIGAPVAGDSYACPGLEP